MTCIFFSLSFLFALYSNLTYVTFIFYLHSSSFIAPVEGLCCKLKYRANIIHHFIFVFFIYFFYHSSCRKDQFNDLNSRFYWSRSTKNPANPHWFVVVVLPSQVFPFWCCAKQYNIYWTNGVNNHTRSYVPREGGCFWREKTAPVVHWKLFNNFD